MNSARDDEEMENDIQEFMSIILAEEDEWEYTDYREIFYDMISSRRETDRDHGRVIKKTGFRQQRREADPVFYHSGGESFAVLPGKHLLRPSGIHRRGILGIVERADRADGRGYFEENHFQVFYAAPPEKINSIGQFIDSAVSLIVTGRYTNAVEGLVKQA